MKVLDTGLGLAEPLLLPSPSHPRLPNRRTNMIQEDLAIMTVSAGSVGTDLENNGSTIPSSQNYGMALHSRTTTKSTPSLIMAIGHETAVPVEQ